MIKYEFHPLAQSLPLMHEPDFSDFCADIKKNGQLLPIGIFEGKILDGRNRYNACKKLGIEGKFERVTPRDAKAYVTSLNVHRRQLTRDQRQHHLMLLIANQDSLGMTNKEVAKSAGVDVSTVKREKSKKGSDEPLVSKKSKNEKKSVQGSNGEEAGMDVGGKAIPTTAQPYWNRKSEAQAVLAKIQAAKKAVKALMPDDPMYCEVNLNGVLSDLRNATNRFASAIPAHVCPYCKGKAENCKQCHGRGVVSEYFWKTAVPQEMKPEMPF